MYKRLTTSRPTTNTGGWIGTRIDLTWSRLHTKKCLKMHGTNCRGSLLFQLKTRQRDQVSR